MALSFVGSAEAGNSGGSDATITLPGGTAEDDVVYGTVSVASIGDEDMAMTTSGYTELADLFINRNPDSNLGVFRKVMGATPDTTAIATNPGSFNIYAVCQVWRGADTSTPEDATTTTDTGTGSTPDSPSITTNTDGAIVLTCGSSSWPDTTVTAPTGYSNQLDGNDGNAKAVMASKSVATAGAEDPGAWQDFSARAGAGWCAVAVAIKPDGGGGGPTAFHRPLMMMGLG